MITALQIINGLNDRLSNEKPGYANSMIFANYLYSAIVVKFRGSFINLRHIYSAFLNNLFYSNLYLYSFYMAIL